MSRLLGGYVISFSCDNVLTHAHMQSREIFAIYLSAMDSPRPFFHTQPSDRRSVRRLTKPLPALEDM